MRFSFSRQFRLDVTTAVLDAVRTAGIVNVPAVAESVRRRNLAENVALEDVQESVLQAAMLNGAPVVFGPSDAAAIEIDLTCVERPV